MTIENRKRILSSLYTFNNEILGYKDMRPQPHDEMCRFIQDAFPYNLANAGGPVAANYSATPLDDLPATSMMLAPRNTFKSVMSLGGITMLPLVWPDVRIMIVSSDGQRARGMLRAIKDQYTANETLIETFGNVSLGAAIWNEEEIIVNTRTKAMNDPTILAVGMGGAVTGRHPDWVLIDDIINEHNWRSPNVMDNAYYYIKQLYSVVNPGGGVILTGTRFDVSDVYGRMMDEDDERAAEGKPRELRTLIRKARTDDGELYFPERLSEKFLEYQQARQTPHMFAAFYWNEPRAQSEVVFQPENIRFFDGEYLPWPGTRMLLDGEFEPQRVNTFILVDPATSAGRNAATTGAAVVSIDEKNELFVWRAARWHAVPSQVVNNLADWIEEFNPLTLSIETVAGLVMYVDLLRAEMGRRGLLSRGLRCSIQQYHPSKDEPMGERGKAQRIASLEPIVAAHRLHLHKGADTRVLFTDLKAYPSIKFNDLLDALAQARRVCHPPKRLGRMLADDLDPDQDFDVDPKDAAATGLRPGTWAGMGSPTPFAAPQAARSLPSWRR